MQVEEPLDAVIAVEEALNNIVILDSNRFCRVEVSYAVVACCDITVTLRLSHQWGMLILSAFHHISITSFGISKCHRV